MGAQEEQMNSYKLIAIAIIFATIVFAWMFRYERAGKENLFHRNRFTGAVCHSTAECWFTTRTRLIIDFAGAR